MKYRVIHRQDSGFTILELMIATLVFSVVLLMLTFGLVRIGQTYYKGVTTSRVQVTARTISDNLVNAIKYGGSAPTVTTSGGITTICAGRGRYRYTVPTPPDFNNSSLTYDEPNNCTAAVGSYRQLLPVVMRLSVLQVIPPSTPPGAYKVIVKVTSGEKDLFNGNDPINGFCKGGAGTQFCAVSDLVTSASPRL